MISNVQTELRMFQNQKEIYKSQIKVNILRNCFKLFLSTCQGLQGEISHLTEDLTAMTSEAAAEKNRSLDLGSRLASMERDLGIEIDHLGSELASERRKTRMDMSSLECQIKTEYTNIYYAYL